MPDHNTFTCKIMECCECAAFRAGFQVGEALAHSDLRTYTPGTHVGPDADPIGDACGCLACKTVDVLQDYAHDVLTAYPDTFGRKVRLAFLAALEDLDDHDETQAAIRNGLWAIPPPFDDEEIFPPGASWYWAWRETAPIKRNAPVDAANTDGAEVQTGSLDDV